MMGKQALIKAAESVKALEKATNSLDEATVKLDRVLNKPKPNGFRPVMLSPFATGPYGVEKV